MGWLYQPKPNAADWDVDIVRCTVCGQGQEQTYLRKYCLLNTEMQTWLLDDAFKSLNPSLDEAIRAAKEAIDERKYFLTFTGGVGTGKTYLLGAIVNTIRLRGRTAVYIPMADLLDHLRRAYDPKHGELSYDGLWEKLINTTCLAIDEIEKFRPSEWAEEKVFQLIDARYRDMNQKLTVFATNRPVEEGMQLLAETRYPGYLESRLLDGRCRVVRLTGADVRQSMSRE